MGGEGANTGAVRVPSGYRTVCAHPCAVTGLVQTSLETQWEPLFLCVGNIRAFSLSRDATHRTPPTSPLSRRKHSPHAPMASSLGLGVQGAWLRSHRCVPGASSLSSQVPAAVIPVGPWCGPRRQPAVNQDSSASTRAAGQRPLRREPAQGAKSRFVAGRNLLMENLMFPASLVRGTSLGIDRNSAHPLTSLNPFLRGLFQRSGKPCRLPRLQLPLSRSACVSLWPCLQAWRVWHTMPPAGREKPRSPPPGGRADHNTGEPHALDLLGSSYYFEGNNVLKNLEDVPH